MAGELQVVVSVGLPASGKSTHFKQLLQGLPPQAHKYICPDDGLYIGEKYVWSEEGSDRAWALAGQAVGEAMRASVRRDISLYFDATLTTKISRSMLLNICVGFGAKVHAVYFDVPFALCLTRNQQRSEGRRVPEETMVRFAKQLVVPTTKEGFTRVSRLVWSESTQTLVKG